jgi:hypothetical protein
MEVAHVCAFFSTTALFGDSHGMADRERAGALRGLPRDWARYRVTIAGISGGHRCAGAGPHRYRAAQDWLDRTTSVAQAADMPSPNVKLFQEFLRWKKTHPLVSKFVSQ